VHAREVRVDNTYVIAALWIGLALLASLISIRVGVSVALIEIALGVLGGNLLALHVTPSNLGSLTLEALAGHGRLAIWRRSVPTRRIPQQEAINGQGSWPLHETVDRQGRPD
jgi:hypothetical protein